MITEYSESLVPSISPELSIGSVEALNHMQFSISIETSMFEYIFL